MRNRKKLVGGAAGLAAFTAGAGTGRGPRTGARSEPGNGGTRPKRQRYGAGHLRLGVGSGQADRPGARGRQGHRDRGRRRAGLLRGRGDPRGRHPGGRAPGPRFPRARHRGRRDRERLLALQGVPGLNPMARHTPVRPPTGRGETVDKKKLVAGATAAAVMFIGWGPAAQTASPTATASAGGSASASPLPKGSEPVRLDPADFTTSIDNPYWPMAPGDRWVYRETDEGTELRVEVTVTDETKSIANGVEARVVHDVVTEDGQPIEVTDDWYAQDRAGNVWYLGEDTAEYEDGRVKTRAGSFEAGVRGAEAGVTTPAGPQ